MLRDSANGKLPGEPSPAELVRDDSVFVQILQNMQVGRGQVLKKETFDSLKHCGGDTALSVARFLVGELFPVAEHTNCNYRLMAFESCDVSELLRHIQKITGIQFSEFEIKLVRRAIEVCLRLEIFAQCA